MRLRFATLLVTILATVTSANAADGPRQHLSLDQHWVFTRGDPANAQSTDFDDKSWRSLNVPHDWSIEGPFEQANPSGGQGGFAPTGIGWYRRHFVAPASFKDKTITAQFDGVYMNATVYLNGNQVTQHAYGYTSFTADLTPNLAPEGKENILAVRVDNSIEPNSRWYTGSGIYRHVWLDVTDDVRVEPWGTYVTTPKVAAQSAEVKVQTAVQAGGVGGQEVTVSQELLDASGKSAATGETTGKLPPVISLGGTRQVFTQSLTVPQPQLWTLDKPAMYTLKTHVSVGGKVVDNYETPVGIRDIQYDVNKGFLLNGEHVKMLGMCLHHDGGAFGAAVPEDVWERRLKILKAMGCNAVRCSHNPPAPEFLDLCDRLGVLVMDEAFDEWSATKGQLRGSYSTLFAQNSQKDLTNMLVRDRNHPSIVMWSIGNEIPQQATPLGASIAKSLADQCHEFDPTRPVTSALDNVHSPNPTRPDFIAALDIAGYNYVDRWGIHREIYFSDDREQFPQRKFVGTEDVCIGGVRGNYFGMGGGGGGRGGAAAPGGGTFGYASNMIRAEQLWKFNATHDYVIGYFMWTGIDYLGESGWPRRGATAGVIDTCGFPKDGYYFYQSQWTSLPMVHLLPHWNYPGEKGAVIPVVVYSNCPQVELQVNGKSFGTKSLVFPRPGSTRSWNDPTPAGTTADLHLAWDVPYEPGTIRAIGKRNNQVVAQEEIHTAGDAKAIALKSDPPSPRGLTQVEVRILDADGNFVPTANNPLTFDVQGPARILALDNGDLASMVPYQSNSRNAFNGMALAYVQSNAAGHIKLTVRAEGLKDAVAEFDATPSAPQPALP